MKYSNAKECDFCKKSCEEILLQVEDYIFTIAKFFSCSPMEIEKLDYCSFLHSLLYIKSYNQEIEKNIQKLKKNVDN